MLDIEQIKEAFIGAFVAIFGSILEVITLVLTKLKDVFVSILF